MIARISRRTRNEAALICAVCASAGDAWLPMNEAAAHLGFVLASGLFATCDALRVASQAWRAAWFHADESMHARAIYAEAEALLRTGFEP